ncbi:MAG: polysaccharide biosynthesis C-terminal domain-containing protein, partial [Sedimentisphaerales bacterium]|nr:polysaccharide biosynthesis C-terminal domain-containing protein [Sedimentisphaerales bacterium]
PLGVLGISLATAIFPVMSADVARKDFSALRVTIAKGLRATIFVAIPASVGMMIVARPLICAAFEHGRFGAEDTRMVVRTLCFYAGGLCGYFAQQVLTRVFYSMQDSKTPARSALVAVLTNFILNLALIWYLDRAGLACATAICSYLQVLMLVTALRKRLGASILDGLLVTLGKTLLATAFMGAAGLAGTLLMRGLPSGGLFDVIRLAVVVPLAAGAYLLAARLLRMEMISVFTGRKAQNR